MQTKPSFLILGAGAIGCFVGGSLAGAGYPVTLVGRQKLAARVASDGLTIHHPTHSSQTVFPPTITNLSALSAPIDYVLLTVKTPDVVAAIDQLVARNITWRYIVTLQNGLGSEDTVAEQVASNRILPATITIPIEQPELGVISVSKAKGGLGIATFTRDAEADQAAEQLAEAWRTAQLTTVVYDDYRAMKWSKLLLNIINNATSAILDLPPAKIIEDTRLFNLEITALQEAVAVMQANSISAVKLPGYPADLLGRLLGWHWLPLPLIRIALRPSMKSGRGNKMPSLHIDLTYGRQRSEIMALNGAIVRAGAEVGVPTPVNQRLTETLQAIISGDIAWADYVGQPEKLLITP